MGVASAERGAANAAAQQAVPVIERGFVQLWPWAIPHLDGVEPAKNRVLPGWAERFGVVDADDGAALGRGAHRSLHRSCLRLAEFPPAVGAPCVPMPAVGGHLESWQDDRKAVAARPVGELVTDVVVVGHTQKIQAGLRRRVEHLLRPRIAVGVERVAMEIPTQPSGTRLWQGIRLTVAHDGAAHPPGAADAGIEPDLDLPVTAAATHLVHAEQDVPGAGTDLPSAVRRGRRSEERRVGKEWRSRGWPVEVEKRDK